MSWGQSPKRGGLGKEVTMAHERPVSGPRNAWPFRVALIPFFLLALVTLALGCQSTPKQQAEKPVRVGLIPNIAPEQQRAKYEPFRAYLQKRLGRPVQLFVATNYAGVVQAMVSRKLDLAYFGGLTYVQADAQKAMEPIVTEIDRETGTKQYYSLIVVRKDSPVRSTKDLAGKTFAFGDPGSTSGSLFPRIMLVEAGFKNNPSKLDEIYPLKQVIFSGGHDATAQAIISGKVDAGGLEGRVLHRLTKEGKVDGAKLRVIDKRLVLGYPWVVPKDLDPKLKRQLTDAFLSITDAKLLDLMRAVRYERVSAGDYRYIREQAYKLGLVNPRP